jgi:hypothetical protein
VARLFLVLMLAVGLVLAGCDAPNSHTEKAAKDGRSADEKGPLPKEPGPKQPSPSSRSAQYSTGPAPKDVLASQYQYVNAGDYGAAYDLFDDQSQQLVSQEQYSAYFASVAPYQITSYSFPSVQIQGDTASVVVDLAVSSSVGEDRYRVTQRMVREDGSWRVVMREEQVASFVGT